MFTLPPTYPKDYLLRNVNNSVASSPQFTPDASPRVTQSNIAKYCYPIQYEEGEVPEQRPITKLDPVIREKMTKEARASWVVEPGKNDFFIHDVYRKYNVDVESPRSRDPRYKHKERVFNRSYKYELDCAEAVRLEKLRQKCQNEYEEFEGAFDKLVYKKIQREKPTLKVAPTRAEAPFWWKAETKKIEEIPTESDIVEDKEQEEPIQKTCVGRWIEEPNLASIVKDDPCRRKYEINL